MRFISGHELPGASWAGWSISGGKLWTPEGYGLDPKDAAWWSLLVRRAETGVQALGELARLKAYLASGNPDSDAASRAAAATALAGGLVPSKTSRQTISRQDVESSQSDVIMTSWPTLYDFPTPSTLPLVPEPTISGSALTPSCVSPWTPTCGVLLSLSRSPTSPHLAKTERPKQGPQSLYREPDAHLKQKSKLSKRTARQLANPASSPRPRASSSPGASGSTPSGRPRGAPAADLDRLADIVTRLSEFIADQRGRVAELDVNPIIIAGSDAVAVDALIVRADPA